MHRQVHAGWLHGGAFMTCGLNTHRSLVARLSRAADAVVLNVGYRLLPNHTLTEAVDDCIDGLQWLRRHGYPPGSMVLAGDSAGEYWP
jgi:acetyl esterase/lipase